MDIQAESLHGSSDVVQCWHHHARDGLDLVGGVARQRLGVRTK